MGFASGCGGLKTDVSVGGDVVFGFWKSLDSIPGKSFVELLRWSRGKQWLRKTLNFKSEIQTGTGKWGQPIT